MRARVRNGKMNVTATHERSLSRVTYKHIHIYFPCCHCTSSVIFPPWAPGSAQQRRCRRAKHIPRATCTRACSLLSITYYIGHMTRSRLWLFLIRTRVRPTPGARWTLRVRVVSNLLRPLLTLGWASSTIMKYYQSNAAAHGGVVSDTRNSMSLRKLARVMCPCLPYGTIHSMTGLLYHRTFMTIVTALSPRAFTCVFLHKYGPAAAVLIAIAVNTRTNTILRRRREFNLSHVSFRLYAVNIANIWQ